MLVIHHNDLDGRCAAFCVRTFYDKDADMHEISYGKPVPWDKIKEHDEVWIVDFSLEPNDMLKLMDITKVVWVDHHASAIKKYKHFPKKIDGIRYDGISGCELTYIHIHNLRSGKSAFSHAPVEEKDFDEFTQKYMPRFIALVGDRDVWRFRYGKDTELFYLGACAQDTKPRSEFWDKLLKDEGFLEKVQEDGKVAKRFRDQFAEGYSKTFGFELEFEGHKCFAMNLGQCGSEYFGEDRAEKYDILIPFAWDGDRWKISLYSTKEGVNCAKLAEKYGGGGHVGSAGMTLSDKVFKSVINKK